MSANRASQSSLASALLKKVCFEVHGLNYSDSLHYYNSDSHIQFFSDLLSNTRMKTNGEIRRDNLLIAIRRKKTAAQLAADAGISAAYLSQIKKRVPESSTGKPKKLGDDVAAKIEQALGEPPGWMDVSHPEQYASEEEDDQPGMGLASVPSPTPEERGPDAEEIIELIVSFTNALPKDRTVIMSSAKAAAKRASLLRRKASGE